MEYFSLNSSLVAKLLVPQAGTTIDVNADHPLLYKWSMLEMSTDKTSKQSNYSTDAMNYIATIGSIADFWRYWNTLPQPSELLEGKKLISQKDQTTVSSVMLFREGIKPAWEDPMNASGGEFQFRLPRKCFGPSTLGLADELWNNLVLGILGGTIQPNSMVTGIRLLDRLSTKSQLLIRVEVWFTSLDKMDPKDTVGVAADATQEQKDAFYELCIRQLQTSIETCMLTRLDGRVEQSHKVWGETGKSMHNVLKKY